MAAQNSPAKQKYRGGRPPKLTSEQVEQLVALVRENPLLSLEDLVWQLRRKHEISISAPTIKKYLAAAGIKRFRGGGPRPANVRPPEPKLKKYGYSTAHRDPGDIVRYPCGLTDSEWEQVEHIFAPAGRPGNPGKYSRRHMLDACIYVLRSGCSWRMLPKDFPPWQAVYKTFRRWQAQGLFESMYDELRRLWRSRQHRAPDPTGAVIDSQSVRTTAQGGPKGYDAAKKIKGRKRHLVTDTLGLLLAVVVTAANIQDRDGAPAAVDLAMMKAPTLKLLYADSGYSGSRAAEIRQRHDIDVEIVRHPGSRKTGHWYEGQLPLFEVSEGFTVLPKRWVIERTNAWNDRPRRMNKDHDRDLDVSEAWIWLAEGRRLLRRLTFDLTAET